MPSAQGEMIDITTQRVYLFELLTPYRSYFTGATQRTLFDFCCALAAAPVAPE